MLRDDISGSKLFTYECRPRSELAREEEGRRKRKHSLKSELLPPSFRPRLPLLISTPLEQTSVSGHGKCGGLAATAARARGKEGKGGERGKEGKAQRSTLGSRLRQLDEGQTGPVHERCQHSTCFGPLNDAI
jgi:hypothetical protein